MTTESLRAWIREHTEQETLQIMRSGETICFERERISTADVVTLPVLHAAYL